MRPQFREYAMRIEIAKTPENLEALDRWQKGAARRRWKHAHRMNRIIRKMFTAGT